MWKYEVLSRIHQLLPLHLKNATHMLHDVTIRTIKISPPKIPSISLYRQETSCNGGYKEKECDLLQRLPAEDFRRLSESEAFWWDSLKIVKLRIPL